MEFSLEEQAKEKIKKEGKKEKIAHKLQTEKIRESTVSERKAANINGNCHPIGLIITKSNIFFVEAMCYAQVTAL